MTSNFDNRGKFAKGNQAAKGKRRRRRQKTAVALIDKTDKLLRDIGQPGVDEQAAKILGALIGQARKGDTRAGAWLLDRLYPAGRVFLKTTLPNPSADPVAYLDALANRVSDGELSVDQVSKLANLARPLLADAELQALRDQVAELVATVERLERTRLQAVES